VHPKKPRGRAFGRGPDNPAKHRSRQPKKGANSLASLLDEDGETTGVSETGGQACSVEQENCSSAKDLDFEMRPVLVGGSLAITIFCQDDERIQARSL